MSDPVSLTTDWEIYLALVIAAALVYLLEGDYPTAASVLFGATAGFAHYGFLMLGQGERVELATEAPAERSQAA